MKAATKIKAKFVVLYDWLTSVNFEPLYLMTSRQRYKPEKENGGCQTGTTCISRSIIDINEIRNAIPMFSRSARPTNWSPTPAAIGRHRNCKMATAKPVVLIPHEALVSIYYGTRDKSATGLTAAILHFWCQSMQADVGLDFIGLGNLGNIGIAAGISFLSYLVN